MIEDMKSLGVCVPNPALPRKQRFPLFPVILPMVSVDSAPAP